MRTHVLQTHEEVGSPERPEANLPLPAELKPSSSVSESLTSASFPASADAPSPGDTSVRFSERHQAAGELSSRTGGKTGGFVPAALTSTKRKPDPLAQRSPAISSPSAAHPSSPEKSHRLTIDQAIQEYLQAHRTVEHRPKTLEWHHMALGHLQQYLHTECHLLLVNQIKETNIRDWLVFLAQTPTTRGSQRSASTIETYAR